MEKTRREFVKLVGGAALGAGMGAGAIFAGRGKARAQAKGDVNPGDVIDKSNWQKVQGIVPDSILNWVKKGDFVLNIGKLTFDWNEYYPPYGLESLKTNVGRFELSKEGQVIDKKTGKFPTTEDGIPFCGGVAFPQIDPKDPLAGLKIAYNMAFERHAEGNIMFNMRFHWVGRGGHERSIGAKWWGLYLSFNPSARKMPNPEGIEHYNIITVTEPYDVAGTSVMTWRYYDNRRDVVFAYLPAMRRVRRTSPANRSDAFMGSDLCMDDFGGYDGRLPDVEWKLLGIEEILLPFMTESPARLDREGDWVVTTKDVKDVTYGYQKKGWTGAPWCPTNIIWVKKKAYKIEMKNKDPYYNYGVQYIWVDVERWLAPFTVIHDRSGKYWKTVLQLLLPVATPDGKYKDITYCGIVMIDDRADHATVGELASPRNKWMWGGYLDPKEFTLSGFQKYCK